MKLKQYLTLLALVLCFQNCRRYEASNPSSPEILQYVSSATQFTILNKIIEKTDLAVDPDYMSSGPYTLFAPNDAAFTKSGFSFSYVAALNKNSADSLQLSRLKAIVKYHFIKGVLNSKILSGFFSQRSPSLYPKKNTFPIVTKNYLGFYINGIKVTRQDVPAGSGFIQEIDSVAFPPSQTISQIIHSRADLTYMALALDSFKAMDTLLSVDTSTFVAYNDSAIRAVGFRTPQGFASIQRYNLLSQYFVNHANSNGEGSLNYIPLRNGTGINFILYTPAFYGGAQYPGSIPDVFNPGFYNPSAIQTTLDGLHLLNPSDPTHLPYLIKRNITATNGVLHIADRVPIFIPH